MSNLIHLKDLTPNGKIKCAKEFSKGSKELENCLKTLWANNLYTKSCSKGHLMSELDFKSLYLYAYIAMDDSVDIFKYLSYTTILNPYILLYKFNNNEYIYFYGEDKFKNIDSLTLDILSGVKNNAYLLEDKINKPMISSLKRKLINDYYLENGFNKSEIKRLNELTDEYLSLEHLFSNLEFNDRLEEIKKEQREITDKVKNRVLKNKLYSDI